uniref:Barttin CLCNK type accessory subunit beta n=1 Tax=Vombatus ursinus TaxID=29139 RepID=A0A4X2KJP9_VOMUR
MAEDKTFRYGFIMLGLFLLAVGMFLMTVDRPQVYVTFCVIGGVALIAGVVWSMCQCYPKIAFVPADADFESFLSPKALGTAENSIPEKKGSQPPYSRLEEDEASGQSPADYRHIQMKVFGPGEDQGVLSAQSLPQSELHAGGEGRGPRSEPSTETTVVVHWSPDIGEAESHQGRPEASQMTGPQITAAPLASFKDELDSNGSGSSRNPSPPEGEEPWSEKADSQPDRYPDFVLIDATGGDEDSPGPSQGISPNFWPGPRPGPESEVAPEEPEEDEEDLYYGLKDGPGGTLEGQRRVLGSAVLTGFQI